MRWLSLLGIDVFTKTAYDTWVLSVIHARIRTNQNVAKLGPSSAETLHRLRAFVNNSCEPNAWESMAGKIGSTAIEVRAMKDIPEGKKIVMKYCLGRCRKSGIAQGISASCSTVTVSTQSVSSRSRETSERRNRSQRPCGLFLPNTFPEEQCTRPDAAHKDFAEQDPKASPNFQLTVQNATALTSAHPKPADQHFYRHFSSLHPHLPLQLDLVRVRSPQNPLLSGLQHTRSGNFSTV